MITGRPPKSDDEKKRKGTYRPSRATGNSVDPAKVAPKKKGRRKKSDIPISSLCDDAVKMYDHAVQILAGYKILTEFDYHLITVMANEYHTYISMKDHAPIEYNAETGLSIVHASVRIKKIALDNFMKIAQQLNLTTAMRIRIKLHEEAKDHDPLAGFIST